jgi:Ca2+-binding EF-hand superfamily protein
MLSELRRRKFTNYFSILDRSGQGMLGKDDLERIVKGVTAVRGLEPGSDEYAAMEAAIMATWTHLMEHADRDRDNGVSLDEWLQTLEDTAADEEKYATYVTPFASGVIALLDLDDDGVVGLAEYQKFFEIFGVSAESAEDSFARLDVKGDGRVTTEEALERVREFHCSDDPNAPGNWLFGPY